MAEVKHPSTNKRKYHTLCDIAIVILKRFIDVLYYHLSSKHEKLKHNDTRLTMFQEENLTVHYKWIYYRENAANIC